LTKQVNLNIQIIDLIVWFDSAFRTEFPIVIFFLCTLLHTTFGISKADFSTVAVLHFLPVQEGFLQKDFELRRDGAVDDEVGGGRDHCQEVGHRLQAEDPVGGNPLLTFGV
jgi:hypothetical protein